MKIRAGHVSNSSSSSFCIMGTSIDGNELKSRLYNNDYVNTKWKSYCKSKGLDEKNENEKKIYIDDMLYTEEINGVCVSDAGTGGDIFFIGLDVSDMLDNDTLSEFKKRAQRKIKDLINKNVVVYWLQEAWY